MTDETQYAYGTDEHEGIEGPVTVAGFETLDSVGSRVAGTYDEILRKKNDDEHVTKGKGLVDESDAQEAWSQTIQEIKNTRDRTKDDDLESYLDECVEFAEKVAEELGWEEEDD